jgi:hypothetical protein
MLISFKRRLAPTERNRKLDLVRQYQLLRKVPTNSSISEWLQRLELVCSQCEEAGMPEGQGDRAVNDFLAAIEPLDSGFSTYWKHHMENMDVQPSISQVIQKFHMARQKEALAPEKHSSEIALASFKGWKLVVSVSDPFGYGWVTRLVFCANLFDEHPRGRV